MIVQGGWADGVGRFLRGVAALGLAVAAGGAVILVLEAAGPEPVSVIAGRGPGTVVLLSAETVGESPFTAPFAVDLDLDPALLASAPRSAVALESPHHRHSRADRILSEELAFAFISAGFNPGRMSLATIERIIDRVAGSEAVVSELDDRDGNGLDDDSRFTVTAFDGSAVCVTLAAPRHLARTLGGAVDADGVAISGVSWSAYGPCGRPARPGIGSDVRVGTTPGTYGGTVAGDVCDVSALAAALAANPVVAAAWAAPLEVPAEGVKGLLDSLTPVVLLADTAVTDYALRGDRVAARQVILERGTAVLVDRRGVPKVRCMSGSPLRAPQALPEQVQVDGTPWPGFSLDVIRRIPAGDRMVDDFILVDVRTGLPVHRPAGVDGVLADLAGPIAQPTHS
ncbi:MAG: DUF6777 domain-containing protein [Actinomycetota bacterium]